MRFFTLTADQRKRYEAAYEAFNRAQAIEVHFRRVQREFDSLLREQYRKLHAHFDEIERLYSDLEAAPKRVADARAEMDRNSKLMEAIPAESEISSISFHRKPTAQEQIEALEQKIANLKAQFGQ